MKLLILSSTLFILCVALVYVNQTKTSPVIVPHISNAQDIATPIPKRAVLTEEPPYTTAKALYVYDIHSHAPLFYKNADQLIPPASTTKMMTALVASEVYEPDMIVTVPYFTIQGQKMDLFSGEKMTIESLLYGTLVESANDAAEVLARVYPLGREAFIETMNMKARKIGMTKTNFKNPTGLDEAGHLSTAREMSLLGLEVMNKPVLRQMVGTTKATLMSADGKRAHYLSSTNALLATIPGVMGIKTGWTEAAHENLVTYVVREDHPIVISLFGSDDRFGETKMLIDWIYTKTNW